MGSRKKHGKDIMDTAPTELPTDLPNGCAYNLGWRNPKNNKIVLFETTFQGSLGYCWAIVFNRVVAAHLFIHEKVGSLLSLSSKHLFLHIDEKLSTGYLKNYKGVKKFLTESGLVLESECKCILGKEERCTRACDKVKDKQVFGIREFVTVEGNEVDEKQIIQLLKSKGPIAAHIRLGHKYKPTDKDDIYFGPKNNKKDVENHIVLLTDIGTKNGVHYFEYQNSWGLQWGKDGGFGKLARKISLPKGSQSLIVAYMYPELLDQVFEVRG